MDAMEGRDVLAICDLPGYFLQIYMEEYLLLHVDGALALLLVKLVWKQWRKHLQNRGKKNPVINAKCNKAIYVTVRAALLSYAGRTPHILGIRNEPI